MTEGTPDQRRKSNYGRWGKGQGEVKQEADISQKRVGWVDGFILQKRTTCSWRGKQTPQALFRWKRRTLASECKRTWEDMWSSPWLWVFFSLFPFSMLIPNLSWPAQMWILVTMLRDMLFISPVLLWGKSLWWKCNFTAPHLAITAKKMQLLLKASYWEISPLSIYRHRNTVGVGALAGDPFSHNQLKEKWKNCSFYLSLKKQDCIIFNQIFNSF